MSEKKYQVFISSTYEDLKAERRAVEETIIRAGDFPVGMEAFPAADEEQFEFIKVLIESCDYYVLIVAGRYGSISEDGMSYTEKEYLHAVEKGIPVLALIHDQRGSLAAEKTEATDQGKQKLSEFIGKVSAKRLRKGWNTIDGLKLAVREALDHAKTTKPRPGWRRGNEQASADVLGELVQLQRENRELQEKLNEYSQQLLTVPNLAGLDTSMSVPVTWSFYDQNGDFQSRTTSCGTTLGEAFGLLAPHLIGPCEERKVSETLGKSLNQKYRFTNSKADYFGVVDVDFQTVKVQLIALGLIEVMSSSGQRLTWQLTKKGNLEMIHQRAMRSEGS